MDIRKDNFDGIRDIKHTITKENFVTRIVPVGVYGNSAFNIMFSFLVFWPAVKLKLKYNTTYYSYIFFTLFSPIRGMMKGKEEEENVKVRRKTTMQY
jgi:hypothetical protein